MPGSTTQTAPRGPAARASPTSRILRPRTETRRVRRTLDDSQRPVGKYEGLSPGVRRRFAQCATGAPFRNATARRRSHSRQRRGGAAHRTALGQTAQYIVVRRNRSSPAHRTQRRAIRGSPVHGRSEPRRDDRPILGRNNPGVRTRRPPVETEPWRLLYRMDRRIDRANHRRERTDKLLSADGSPYGGRHACQVRLIEAMSWRP